jgi:LysR family transcriptional regulator, regulatory protein for tcuABC
MDIRQLKYFAQVVESGSLSSAARQLYIAQPALSQQMAKLEDEVGKPLLVRSVRGVAPTQNGQALYLHAKFMLRQFEEALAIARQETGSVGGRVTVGLSPSTGSVVGLPLLRRLQRTHPGILLNVFTALPGYLEEKARLEELDVAVLHSRTAANELTSEPLLDEDVYAVLRGGTKLVAARKTSLSLREVAQLPLVMSTANHGLLRRFAIELERAEVVANVVAELDSLLLVMRYVAESDAATIQPMAATHTFNAAKGWRCLRIADAPMVRSNFLFSLPARKLSPSAVIVRDELRKLVHELVADGTWQGVRLA